VFLNKLAIVEVGQTPGQRIRSLAERCGVNLLGRLDGKATSQAPPVFVPRHVERETPASA